MWAGGQSAQAAVKLGELDVSRILFLGNSITYHESKPSIGWTGTWGMAASSQDKDYVHVLTTAIAKRAGATPEIMVTNIAEFEWYYRTYAIASKLASELAFKPTLLVMAIGENATVSTDSDKAAYETAFTNLLATFKTNSSPAIFTRSCFWADGTKDSIMEEVTKAEGGTFVDIGNLYSGVNSVMCAYGDPTSAYYHDANSLNTGVGGHPGNQGMAAIASALETSIVASSVPEPPMVSLLLVGAACLWISSTFKRRIRQKAHGS